MVCARQPAPAPPAAAEATLPVSNLDRAEFRTVFEAERQPLFRFLFRLTHNASDAEDLLQETFLAVWRKRDQFEGRGSVGGYLRSTAWRLYLNARERDERRAALAPKAAPQTEMPDESDPVLETSESAGFLLQRVRDELGRLPDGAREAFVLFRYEGLSCAEIAALTGAPLKTVESRVARATRQLAERLRPYRHLMPSS
jgi:RNA polymerase sigma-70 factor (ECF subfamily)